MDCGVQPVTDCSNWASTETNDRGQVATVGNYCLRCVHFASLTPYKTVEGVEKAKKDAKDATALEEDRDEYNESVSHPEKKSVPREALGYVVVNGSRVEERMPFLSRTLLKELHGIIPKDATLDQMKVTGASANEVQGVVMTTDRLPELVVWTEKIWVKRREEIKPAETQYSRQVSSNFDHTVAQLQTNLGQKVGGSTRRNQRR